jgi:hypothetical protein
LSYGPGGLFGFLLWEWNAGFGVSSTTNVRPEKEKARRADIKVAWGVTKRSPRLGNIHLGFVLAAGRVVVPFPLRQNLISLHVLRRPDRVGVSG